MPEVIGSMLVLPAKVKAHFENFDYFDISIAKTMLLRMENTAIIIVLDDSGAALNLYYEELTKIGGPLSPLQLREIAARLAAINFHLTDRPKFSSTSISSQRNIKCWVTDLTNFGWIIGAMKLSVE